jgi:adenosylmethionine-8-amino-7-oxononanoate aminotransferase
MKIARLSFLQKILAICREFDILVIFDEVMTGFGRTGEMFAFEKILKYSDCKPENSKPFYAEKDFFDNFYCIPDIIVLSKVITNGLFPFGITACNSRVYKPFYSSDNSKTFLHSHSHTGNPIICASAVANLKVLQEEKTISRIKQIEIFLSQFASDLHLKYRSGSEECLIEKIRFCGTILAFDVSQDAFYKIKNRLFDGSEFKEFLLANKNIYIRPIKNSIFIIPPYIITVKQLRKYLNIIIESLYLM